MDQPEVRYTRTSDDVTIAYWAVGDGPHLLHLQPRVSNIQKELGIEPIRSWYERLADRFTLVRFDRRGEGLSQRDAFEMPADSDVLDSIAVIDALGYSSVTVLGLRSSGVAALELAASHSDRVDALIMLNTVAGEAQMAGNQLVASATSENWNGVAELLAFRYVGWATASVGEEYARLFQSSTSPEVVRWRSERASSVNSSELRASLDVPTLVIAGEAPDRAYEDRLRLDAARQEASEITGAKLTLINGLPIAPWHQAADQDAIVQAIDRFLSATIRTSGVSDGVELDRALQTILFTDIEASTELTQRVGDARAQDALHEHNNVVREALDEYGGREVKHTGDGIMGTFPSAVNAVDAALQIQRNLDDAAIRVRVGLNAGEPIAEDSDLFGLSVIKAARIADRAEPGQVLVSRVVVELCEGKRFTFNSVGEVLLKGFAEPVEIFAAL